MIYYITIAIATFSHGKINNFIFTCEDDNSFSCYSFHNVILLVFIK